jgi:hypothetical protein
VFAVALVTAAASALGQEGASTARPPEDLAFFCLRADASIRLTPSDLCAATLARDEQERGVAATYKELEPPPWRRPRAPARR